MKKNKKTLAIFDFDGTITTRDSLFPFLIYCFGWTKTLWKLSLIAPYLALFPLGFLPRQRAKEAVLALFFRGWKMDDLRKLAVNFSKEKLDQEVRPEAFERIAWHRLQGHTLVLVSASIQVYLEPWGQKMGFEHVLTSLLEVVDGCVTGKLAGENCRSKEKVRRLQEIFGDLSNYEIYAYGDSKGDLELLAIADRPFYRQMPKGI